jgi:hypothetical protein
MEGTGTVAKWSMRTHLLVHIPNGSQVKEHSPSTFGKSARLNIRGDSLGPCTISLAPELEEWSPMPGEDSQLSPGSRTPPIRQDQCVAPYDGPVEWFAASTRK